MKTPVVALFFAAVFLIGSGCSTVDSRIGSHQTAFNSWPPQVQQLVRAGNIAIGFTAEQVRVALGDPDHVLRRADPRGVAEIWSYADRKPRFGFGVGGSSFHGGSAYGAGVGVSSGGYRGERRRVIFDQTGHVTSIEEVQRR